MPQLKDKSLCALRGCEAKSDPEIFFVLTEGKVLCFCCDNHLLRWDAEMVRIKTRAGLGERTDKVDATVYS